MILLIDNYDSFVFNLQRYLIRLGQAVTVVRNDDPRLAAAFSDGRAGDVSSMCDALGGPQAIVISPGPKRPGDAGYCIELVQRLSGAVPILGVCLGHQVIYEAFGGQVVRAVEPMHGRASPIQLGKSELFTGLPSGDASAAVPFARYHSLVAEAASLPECLRVTAWSTAVPRERRQIMAVEHRQQATFGIQFHPESILSPHGYRVLYNFLKCAAARVPDELPSGDVSSANQLAAWRVPTGYTTKTSA